MERLTNKREADAQREGYERRLANGYQRSIPVERFLRLAAYEDTGLMPNDVTDMMAANGNAICEIVKLKEELQGAKNTAEQYAAINETLFDSNMKLGADRKALKNELCQYCGKYKQAHEGACDGCRWREM
mgnify:CR=1 FL=1|nr:MAG TPA: hypothetical protein [Caudoviricetes sp.]